MTPTLYEWAGGAEALDRLTMCFYRRVHDDQILAPVFAGMSPSTPTTSRCGWARSSAARPSTPRSTAATRTCSSKHLGLALTEEQRARWVALITPAADDAEPARRPRVPLGAAGLRRVGHADRAGQLAARRRAAARGAGAALGLGRGAPVPAVSCLGDADPPFRARALLRRARVHRRALLCSSDVEAYGLRELLALADDETRGLWDGLSLGYTETAGHPLLRAEIAALYPGLEADDVLVFAGAEEAIFAFAQARARRRRPRRRRHAGLPVAARGRARRGRGGEHRRARARRAAGRSTSTTCARALRPTRARSSSTSLTTRPGRTSTARPSTGSWRSPRRRMRTSSPTRSTAGSSTRPRRCCPAPPSCRPAR